MDVTKAIGALHDCERAYYLTAKYNSQSENDTVKICYLVTILFHHILFLFS